MRILWIEDESNVRNRKTYYFAEFHDDDDIDEAHDFIEAKNKLEQSLHCYDLLIIDIDLRHSSYTTTRAELENYLQDTDWELNADALLHEAGFHLFLCAYRQHFPPEAIAFFTGNINTTTSIDRIEAFQKLLHALQTEQEDFMPELTAFNAYLSDAEHTQALRSHIENEDLKSLQNWYETTFNESLPIDDTGNTFKQRFIEARIPFPTVFDKKNKQQIKQLRQWLTDRCMAETPQCEYLRLRRGILDSIIKLEKHLLKAHYDENLDKNTFLEGLAWLLKPHHNCPNNPANTIYLALCDYLVKPFDKGKSGIPTPKHLIDLRNWMAHGNIRSSGVSEIKPVTLGLVFLLSVEELFETHDLYKQELEPSLQKLLESSLPAINTNKKLDTSQLKQEANATKRAIKSDYATINFIKLFYACCLVELDKQHALYSYLNRAYQQEITIS